VCPSKVNARRATVAPLLSTILVVEEDSCGRAAEAGKEIVAINKLSQLLILRGCRWNLAPEGQDLRARKVHPRMAVYVAGEPENTRFDLR
jgi:hypothetical protein